MASGAQGLTKSINIKRKMLFVRRSECRICVTGNQSKFEWRYVIFVKKSIFWIFVFILRMQSIQLP